MTVQPKYMIDADPDAHPGPVSETVAINYLRPFFEYVQRQGVILAELLTGTGIDPGQHNGRVAVEVCQDLFRRAAHWLQDEDIGLHAGSGMRLGHYGAAAYAALSCQWGWQALLYFWRYQTLVMDVGSPKVLAQGDTLCLRWHTNAAWRSSRHLLDYNLAGLLASSRRVMGEAASPLRVEMAYAEPAAPQALQDLCGCTVVYDQPAYALIIPLALLGYALPEPNPEVCQAMARLADQQLQTFSREDSFLAQVRRLLATRIGQGLVSQEELAQALAMHPRTLQRRLGEQGVTYSQLVDEVRRSLAATYIRDPHLSLGEVAFLLGFAEQSTFQKCFKRWFGETPGRYRRQVVPG